MSETGFQPSLLRLTAQIAAAHASHNTLTSEDLLKLIATVYGALAASGQPVPAEVKSQPAVPVKKSVFRDYIICLEDGKELKMLKRHLLTRYNLTPDQYRQKWGLPADYPMVAPGYAAVRSSLAKASGLGRKPEEHEEPPAPRSRRGRSAAAE
ncbi:MAG: MucR family transcriptional regulator [Bradyrhizobium sp.]|nr:MucR family transcriptional regulator [Bradyrhizobium sp.]